LSKNNIIFWGEVIKILHCITGGMGGGLGSPKMDYVIFEQSPFITIIDCKH